MRCGNSKRGKKGISCSKMKETEVSNLPGKMDTSVCLCGMLSFVAPSPDAHFFRLLPIFTSRLLATPGFRPGASGWSSHWCHARAGPMAGSISAPCTHASPARNARLPCDSGRKHPGLWPSLVCVPRSGPSGLLATAQTLFTCCNRKIPCRSCGPGGPPGPACA